MCRHTNRTIALWVSFQCKARPSDPVAGLIDDHEQGTQIL
jgi:hypothetical protein